MKPNENDTFVWPDALEMSDETACPVERLVMPTPGPWKWDGNPVDYNHNEEAPWLMHGDHTRVLTGEITAHNDADVRLIAAAPDLLNACQHIMKCFNASTNWNGDIEKVIAIVEKALTCIEA